MSQESQENVECQLVHWSIGPLVHGTIGPLVHWTIGPLVHWSIVIMCALYILHIYSDSYIISPFLYQLCHISWDLFFCGTNQSVDWCGALKQNCILKWATIQLQLKLCVFYSHLLDISRLRNFHICQKYVCQWKQTFLWTFDWLSILMFNCFTENFKFIPVQ